MALHAEAARELAATGADAFNVAQQLSAARQPGGGWARAWLIQTAPTLTTRAPQLAADLLRRELDATPSGDEAWDGLMASLVRALLATGSYDEAARQARAALSAMTDLTRRAETCWVLARAWLSPSRRSPTERTGTSSSPRTPWRWSSAATPSPAAWPTQPTHPPS